MKRLIKIFIYFIVIILFLLIALIITAKLAENKIADIALKKVSEKIEAPVSIGEVSLNLLRKFPLATIELNNVFLGEHRSPFLTGSHTIKKDTIVGFEKIYVSVKSKPLLDGIIEIIKVDVEGAIVNYRVDSTGKTNIDFLMDTTSTTPEIDTVPSEPLNITLTDFTAKNIVCNFNDSSLKAKAKITIPELKLKARLKGEDVIASVKGAINLKNSAFDNTNLYLMKNTDIDFDIDYENDSANIKELLIDTDGADLDILGNVVLGENIKTDLSLKGRDLILGELIKYAPKEMLDEFGIQKLSGKLNLDAKASGVYADNEMPRVDASIQFQNGNVKTKDYPEIKNISFKGKASNGALKNNQTTSANFSTFHFETQKSKFDFNFSVLNLDKIKYDVKTTMDIYVDEFRSFIPDTLLKHIDGNVRLNIATNGVLPDSIDDDFTDYIMAKTRADIQFNNFNVDIDTSLSVKNFSSAISYVPNNLLVKNLNIQIPAYKVQLKNTSFNTHFTGSINDFNKMAFDLKSFHIETKQSEIRGTAKVKNLDKPNYSLKTNIKLNLDEVKTMLPDTLLNTLTGTLTAKIESAGILNLDSIADKAMDIVFNKSTFNLGFDNISVKMPDDPLYKLQNFSGQVKMKPGLINIDKMKGFAGGLINFEIDSTTVENLYNTFIQENINEQIIVQTNIKLDKISNELLGIFMPQDSVNPEQNQGGTAEKELVDNSGSGGNSSEEIEYLLPDFKEKGLPYFLVRGKLAVDNIEYEKNIIDDLSLKFRFADSLYAIEDLKFKTCGGELNTSVLLDARKWDKPKIDVRNYIANLDIKELLYVNDNFGDTSITYDKVRGILTSELHVRAFYIDNDFPTEKVRAKGHFTLEEGRIYDYEPLVELSKNKLVGGLKELDKLDFNTLNTSLFMYKNKIYIPKTDVVTSSMDFTAFAMHSFDDDYEYHIKIHLGDVLTGKNKKVLKEQAKQNKKEGSTVERSGLKLVSLKKGDDKKNGFDNERLEKKFKNSLNKQQGFLNLLFNPLLVNFSTDLDRTIRNQKIIDKYKNKEN